MVNLGNDVFDEWYCSTFRLGLQEWRSFILTKTTCEVAEATLDLVMALLLLALGLLGLVVVVYLIYLVLAMVFQWKVRLPFRRPEGAAPRTITRRVHEVDKEGKC